MKKFAVILIVTASIIMALGVLGCRERSVGWAGIEPTATFTFTSLPSPSATPTPKTVLTPMIDDFADCDGNNNFGGPWFSYGASGNTVNGSTQATGYGNVDCGYHMTGSTAISCGYGAWVSTSLLSGAVASLNNFTGGIRFYAKTSATGTSYRFVIISNATTNNYQYTFSPGSDWALVSVPFSSFTQAAADYGIVTIQESLGAVTNLAFANSACNQTLDLWVDNIELY